MRVLVACEFSGIVRDAFAARGHDAWSCDLLPSERPGLHMQCDVRTVLGDGWDLMIAHPPCTYLSVSGLHWNQRRPERATMTEESIAFVSLLLHDAPIQRVAVENPIGILSTRVRKPEQIIQPWQFGDDASKATCLWLKNLPPLTPTNILPGGKTARRANQTASGQNKLGPSPDRWKNRSRTYQGIADAMAEQWGRPRETPRRTCAQCGSTRPATKCEDCGSWVCDRPEYIATQYSSSPDEPSCQQEHAQSHRKQTP